jgi:imidazolonepropionase-like amidohydrolase
VRDHDGEVNLLRDLALSGLPTTVGSDSYLGGHELRDVLAFAVRGGLSPGTAVRMVTGDAAKVLGVADRVGTIAPGKDADLVLLSAPPFAAGARIVSVYVGGEEVRNDSR